MPLYYHKLNFKASENYIKSNLSMPSGAIFHASLNSNTNTAETGQTLIIYGESPIIAKIGGISCLQFNGSGYLTSSENNIPTGTEPFTMSIWEYLPSRYSLGNHSQCIFSFGVHSGTNDIEIDDYSYSDKHRVISWDNAPIVVNWSEKEILNKWINLIVVNDGNNVTFYINGIQKEEAAVWFNISYGSIDIGGYLDNSSWWLRGYLTSAYIYNRVLTREEIATLSQEFIPMIEYSTEGFDEFGHSIEYNSAEDANCNNVIIPKEGLVFYASLNGKTQNKAQTGQTLVSSNISYDTVSGISCCLFNGNNSSYIFSSDNTNLPLSNQPSTLSCWFRLKDTNSTNQIFFAYGYADENKIRGLACAGGSDRYACSILLGANGDNKSSFQFEKNVWYHVCCTFDANYQKLYLNGSLIEELNYSGMNTTFEKISLGGYFYADGSTLQEYCNCYISSARIYNRVLTTDEITLLSKEFKIEGN